jgi:hypothetical protein
VRADGPEASLFFAWCRPPAQLIAVSHPPTFSRSAAAMKRTARGRVSEEKNEATAKNELTNRSTG